MGLHKDDMHKLINGPNFNLPNKVKKKKKEKKLNIFFVRDI